MPVRAAALPRTLPLELCFRGQRDYVQAADIYEAVAAATAAEAAGAISRYRLSVRRFLRRQPDLHWFDGPLPERPPSAVAEFSLLADEREAGGWLLESERAVARRVPFDEGAIAACCAVRGRTIAAQGVAPGLPSEVAVSMTKQLHQAVLPPPAGRWIFAKLELDRLLAPSDVAAMAVSLKDNLHGRLTRSEIAVAGRCIGAIFFSLVPK